MLFARSQICTDRSAELQSRVRDFELPRRGAIRKSLIDHEMLLALPPPAAPVAG